MKILWFTWKDKKNPLAGGAEIMNEELAERLVKDGNEVIFITAGFSRCEKEEIRNGFKIIRVGNRWTVYWHAFLYYKKYLSEWPDFVIDEVNTIPFFVKFYVKQKNILIVYQLCREIWFYQMFFPLNIIGYILEPIYLWLLNDRKVITISESSKKDLVRFGFRAENIYIISVGIEIEPVNNLEIIKKFENPTILFLGAIRSMKRTAHIITAFEIAKKSIPNLELIVTGDASGTYGQKVLNLMKDSRYSDSIQYLGRVDISKKVKLMQESHLIVVASVKEGWGLIVTEANSQGTPAVVYNVDGLREAVKDNQTGLICDKNTPENLAEKMTQILRNIELYKKLQKNGWEWSKKINFENSYKEFILKING
jgi:glycosyltransferase involved in cell wall biosynthesis